jgi:hypothetical protein
MGPRPSGGPPCCARRKLSLFPGFASIARLATSEEAKAKDALIPVKMKTKPEINRNIS